MVGPFRLTAFAVGIRLTRLAIATLGFARTVRIMDRVPMFGRSPVASPESLEALAEAVAQVSRSPYHANCLTHSVFLWFVMQRRDMDCAVRIGLSRRSALLEAHAWVELNGIVINDDADIADYYMVFDEDPTGIVFV
jgi:hypothetical protein